MVDSFLPMSGEKYYKKLPRKTFIEDGGMSVLPMATGYFPKPVKGQSLMSFLTSSQFARANAELDRENAHFSVSEAIISAMEQIRCKKSFRLVEEQLDESDPEIMDLKQKIRLRRTKRVLETQKKSLSSSLMSDGKTDTTTTVSPCSSTASGTDDSSSDYVEELEINETSNLEENSGLSMSMASLYSEADLMRRNTRGAPDGSSDILSAEGVALSLISKFSDKQLPRASDLEWLVSEKDAPQALLPLPKSWPVSPDSADEHVTPLRGTEEWAPPRAQIIFTLHPVPVYYPVSTFSYRLLEQMYTDPLFRIFSLNKNVGKLSKSLEFYKRLRLGLHYLKDFILTCRYAEQIRATLEDSMGSSLAEPDMYSMDDLCKIRSGELIIKLKNLVDICCRHTSECQLCLARGFICEFCGADEVIFPWQMRSVSRCDKCGSCYHMKCWSRQVPCKKCSRIQRRKESTDSTSSR
uniref:Run domain Beclin-1-interacting and cysteine-rich domain-containing protein n=1 Tax=Diabrotica virgifera virgifera TaxID=50390 RepID=A0A6P7FP69_DIAVI